MGVAIPPLFYFFKQQKHTQTMAFRKISELSSSLTPSGSGIIPIVINGTTFGTTLDAIKDQINSVLTPQYASSSITSSVDTLIGNVSSLNTFTSSADGRLDSIEILKILIKFI